MCGKLPTHMVYNSSPASRLGGCSSPAIVVVVAAALLAGCGSQGKPGHVLDEPMRAHRTAASFPAADEDYFHDMDGGVALTREEVQGRNMWIVWTGGNDRFWDTISVNSLGTLDFLKTISSHPTMPYGRDSRFRYLGLVNEPCFTKATGPDPNHYGLWLDQRDPSCPPDPFANASKYPGVQLGARGKNVAVGSYYGEPTGIVGLRLFPNPDFDEAAKRKWDSERFYRDPNYYFSRDLVKPYRVGMSCAFCHVGPDPTRPPADPENPKWENLTSNVGAQYFWVDRIFNWQGDNNRRSFFFQLFHTSRPGSLDTSLVSTDNINNPRTMNAVYLLGARMGLARKWGKETLAGGALDNRQFNDFVPASDPLSQFFVPPNTTYTPRVLKDGADSVGALGALNRVYLNIGLFSEEWLLHFRPIIGGQKITPIRIADARKNSVYWQATEMQTPMMARFFLKTAQPHHLKDAPGGPAYLTEDAATLRQGKVVFAERCARCHSSKLPDLPPGLDMADCNGKDYLSCWNRYWEWTKTDQFKNQIRTMVLADDFLQDNYLSTELRVPSTLLQTNVCSPLATNAIAGDIWDNFSSASYKELPSVGSVTVRHPVTGAAYDYALPGGGRGFTRPASLVSVWSTAPFLQNNTIGRFDPSPSVEARMRVFNDSIEKLLWPEKREKDRIFANDNGPGVGVIDRTNAESAIWVPSGYVPDELRPLLGAGRRLFPFFFRNGSLEIGPIPQGYPVNLLANIDMLGPNGEPPKEHAERNKAILRLFRQLKDDLKAGRDAFNNPQTIETMLSLSKCKDFVVNKGHYFGTNLLPEEPGLSDADKRALIGFLKTM
jgi:hypothetical protein